MLLNQTKKFAKPELKSCIEEFEEKLVKFHIEKKEQERTAQNAETHKQKLSSLENFVAAKNGEDSSDSEIVEGRCTKSMQKSRSSFESAYLFLFSVFIISFPC